MGQTLIWKRSLYRAVQGQRDGPQRRALKLCSSVPNSAELLKRSRLSSELWYGLRAHPVRAAIASTVR